AICAAVTEPWPVGVDAGPFMSVRTPILTTSSETWASAGGEERMAAAQIASRDVILPETTGYLPFSIGTLAASRVAGNLGAPCLTLQLFAVSGQTRHWSNTARGASVVSLNGFLQRNCACRAPTLRNSGNGGYPAGVQRSDSCGILAELKG